LFIAELLRVIGLDPSFPNVEKGKMVSTALDKVLSGLVSVKLFVLRAIEKGRGFGQHCYDGEDLEDQERVMR
jgi:hypothetical protein